MTALSGFLTDNVTCLHSTHLPMGSANLETPPSQSLGSSTLWGGTLTPLRRVEPPGLRHRVCRLLGRAGKLGPHPSSDL